MELLKRLEPLPQYIVIDGYVYLGGEQRSGFGKHLYNALEEKAVVIGVAKSRFKDTATEVEVFRGSSQRPLYVTAVGISGVEAKGFIAEMCGPYRVPTLLKLVDKLSKQFEAAESSLVVPS